MMFAFFLLVSQLPHAFSLPSRQRAFPTNTAPKISPLIPHTLGVNVHSTGFNPTEFELFRQLGLGYVRYDLAWERIEKVRGEYDFVGSGYDSYVRVCEEAGVIPYFVIDYANPLYDQGLSPYSDEGRAAFADFALAAISRYSGKGFLWEIWNEPNWSFWKPFPNVHHYCLLANLVISRTREKFPNETLVGPATSRVAIDFLNETFHCGLLEGFDLISVHPYECIVPEECLFKWEDGHNLIDEVSRHLGVSKKPLISGEWGFNVQMPIIVGTDERQAKLLGRSWATNAMSGIPLSIWFDWHDNSDASRWGIVNVHHEPKMSYHAAMAYVHLLSGSMFSARQTTLLPWHYVLEFVTPSDENLTRFVVWSVGEERIGSVEVLVGQLECFETYDYLGNSLGKKCGDSSGILRVKEVDSLTFLVPIGK